MSNLSTFSTFQKNWLARSQIAQDEGIPSSAIKSTISNDYNRLLAGDSPMSSQDAFAGMESAGVGHVITQDPSGNGNLATNAFHDAQGIFTGIFHAPSELLHTGENLVSGGISALEGKGLKGLETGISQVAQLLPGVTDAEQLAKGNFDYLWQHPLFSALDLSGMGGVASKIADVATGATTAAKAAASAEDLAAQQSGMLSESPNVKAVPNLSKDDIPITFANILASHHPALQLAGRAIKQSPLDPILNKTLGPWGLYGNRVMDLIRPANVLSKLGQTDFQRVASQLVDSMRGMEPDDIRQLQELLTNPKMGQTPEAILSDSTINNVVKDGYKGWQHLVDDYNARAIQSGHNTIITNPRTGEQVVVGAQSAAAKLIRNHDTLSAKFLFSQQKILKTQQAYLDARRPVEGPYYKPVDGAIADPNQLLNAHDFIATTRQALSNTDPSSFIAVGTGQYSKESIRNAIKRYRNIFSDSGPVAVLEQALASNDKAAIKTALSKVKNQTNSKFYNHVPQFQQLRHMIEEYQKAAKINPTKYSNAVERASQATASIARRLTAANNQIDKQWRRVTADNYEQVIAQIMTNELKKKAITLPVDEEQLSSILDLLDSKDLYPTAIQPFISAKDWQLVRQSAISSYDKLIESGAKVFWVPKVTETEHPGFIRIGTDRLPSVSSAKSRALNFSYTIQNPYLGLAKAWQEEIARERTDEFYETNIKPRLIPAIKIQKQSEDEYQLLKSNHPDKAPKSWQEYYHHMYSNYMNFTPSDFLHENSRHIRVSDNIPMMIDTADYQLLQHMGKTVRNPATRVWDSSLNLFRHAVLTISPRFFAHITLGGAFLTLLKTGPSILKFFPEAHRLVTEGEMPAAISHGIGYDTELMGKIHDPQKFHLFLGGNSLGRWFNESIAKRYGLDPIAAKAQAYHEFLETWSDHYRAMAYLYGKNRYEKKGNYGLEQHELTDAKRYDLSPSEYAGVKLANKVLADNNARTPLERTVIRFAFPFGGWSKHVLRYVLQFPLDHPLRTNFLSNLFEQSYEADTSGLPQYLFHLLFIGHPDALGNITAIDDRQWNPLRDVANYMTLSGIVSQLNPLAGGILTAMGINASTGSPELYPQLSYSSFYGGYQVQAPTGNTALSMVGSYIPEFGLLDHYLKISNYTRSLARYDPAAYHNQLWQSLNIPWAPQQLNIDQIISKQETDRLNTLKTMATNALSQNDPSQLNNQPGPFPFDGWYFSSGQIKSIIDAANEWTKQTGIQLPASALLQTPSAPTIPLGITPPVTLAPEELAGQTTGQPSS